MAIVGGTKAMVDSLPVEFGRQPTAKEQPYFTCNKVDRGRGICADNADEDK
jgi:hypothetical protein